MSGEAFKREINKYEILFLCETWLHKGNTAKSVKSSK